MRSSLADYADLSGFPRIYTVSCQWFVVFWSLVCGLWFAGQRVRIFPRLHQPLNIPDLSRGSLGEHLVTLFSYQDVVFNADADIHELPESRTDLVQRLFADSLRDQSFLGVFSDVDARFDRQDHVRSQLVTGSDVVHSKPDEVSNPMKKKHTILIC